MPILFRCGTCIARLLGCYVSCHKVGVVEVIIVVTRRGFVGSKEVMILGSGLSRNEIPTQVLHCVEYIEIITKKM